MRASMVWVVSTMPAARSASAARTSGSAEPTMRAASSTGVAACADRDRGDGHTFGHLHDREQRVEPVEPGEGHRQPYDRERRDGGQHAGQMSGTTCGTDEDPQSPIGGGLGVSEQSWGVRWADSTRASAAMPSSASTAIASPATDQSDSLPITTPTSGPPRPAALMTPPTPWHPRCRTQRVVGGIAQSGDVTELATGTPGLAVEVDMHRRVGEGHGHAGAGRAAGRRPIR